MSGCGLRIDSTLNHLAHNLLHDAIDGNEIIRRTGSGEQRGVRSHVMIFPPDSRTCMLQIVGLSVSSRYGIC